HGDALVGLGAAGDGELAAVGNDAGRRHRDAEELLRRAVAGAHGRAALRCFVRKQVPGCDPQPGGDYEADGGHAARFHRELPWTLWATRVPVWVGRARTKPNCAAATIAARRMDRSWALARRMIGSPPTPYCGAANSSESSLTSLAKLRLIPSPVPHRSHAPQ